MAGWLPERRNAPALTRWARPRGKPDALERSCLNGRWSRAAELWCYHGACFETCACLRSRTLGTLQALAHACVDLLAEEVALLASHATTEASRSHDINGDSAGTSTALN